MEEKEKLRLRKLIKELEKIRGRHTELVSVYIPSGYNIVEVSNQLFQEKSTASNIKSKTTRKNVLAALEKIIQHLKLFKQTPPNGLIVFCGNVSPIEGKEDIKLWSIEPPEPMKTKIYWCDQVFVLDPLKDLVREKEVYGLIVLDTKEANIGILRGRHVQQLRHIESLVPGKTTKGGFCVSPNTLLQAQYGEIKKVSEVKIGEKICSLDFNTLNITYAKVTDKKKRKTESTILIKTNSPTFSIEVTPEHRFFIVDDDGFREKIAEELKEGDYLLIAKKLKVKTIENELQEPNLFQLLGYIIGDATFEKNRFRVYEKSKNTILFYQKLVKKLFDTTTHLRFRKGCYELTVYGKRILDFLKLEFGSFKRSRYRKIPKAVMMADKQNLSAFIRGLFDAEGYISQRMIGITMSSEQIIKTLQILLLRFSIVSSVRESETDKKKFYTLRITDRDSISKFKLIGFSSRSKNEKFKKIQKNSHSYENKVLKVPINGKLIRKLAKEVGITRKEMKSVIPFLSGKRNISYEVFNKRVLPILEEKLIDRKKRNFIHRLVSSNIIKAKIKSVKRIKKNSEFYDLEINPTGNFIANGIVVHNSQMRYQRVREGLINDFLKKVGEQASNLFLKEKDLKGVIVGGPGPIKDQFVKGEYLNYQVKQKLLGVKDTSYTGEYGLNELVKRSEDLMSNATIVRERQLLEKFFSELRKGGNVVYGVKETIKALESGAVETLLISEDFNWVHATLKCSNGHTEEKNLPVEKIKEQKCKVCGSPMSVEKEEDLTELITEKAKVFNTKVVLVSVDTDEGMEFKQLGGIGGFLRYRFS